MSQEELTRGGLLSKIRRGIFVLDHHGFGNVMMSLPLLQAINLWAKDRCSVRVLFRSPDHFRLIQKNGLDIEPIYLGTRYKGIGGLYNLWNDFRETTDLLIAVPGVPILTAIAVRMALKAKYLAGEALPSRRWLFSVSVEKGWIKSVLETQKELALSLGFEMASPYPALCLSAAEEAWGWRKIDETLGPSVAPIIGVHCNALTPAKQWPPRFFGETLSLLKEKFPRLGVISFGSENERSQTAISRDIAGGVRWFDGVGIWEIRESLAILKQCDVMLSGDTGIMHMAASLGVPTVSVFGPTSAARLAPFHTGGVCATPPTPCHPCFRDRWTPCTCIQLIRPEQVVALIERCLLSHA